VDNVDTVDSEVLALDGVSARLGGREVLREVSFRVTAG
jgi:hypothetical protein